MKVFRYAVVLTLAFALSPWIAGIFQKMLGIAEDNTKFGLDDVVHIVTGVVVAGIGFLVWRA